MRSSLVTAALGAVATLAMALAGGGVDEAGAKPKPQTRPNLIVILLDDMPMSYLEPTSPNTIELLGNQGTTFSEFVVTTPLCCPSRATFLTGQYGHNNGILANRPGYPDLVDKQNTLPVWLRRAGYETIHIGRYLNGYKQFGSHAVGARMGRVVLGARAAQLLQLRPRGKRRHRPLRQQAEGLPDVRVQPVRDAGHPPALQGVEAVLHPGRSPRAPRRVAQLRRGVRPKRDPRSGDLARFSSSPLPSPPNYDEADMSDKPQFLHVLEPIDEFVYADLQREWQCRMASMLAVDRGVQRIVSTLAAKGELDNTMVAFTSDNGFYNGEHRVPFEKYLPYEEGIHMPMLVRFPTSVGAVPDASTR